MPVKQIYINSRQFKKELDSKKLAHVYLFLGEEEGEKDKYINILLDIIFPDPESRASATGRFHLENDEMLEAADFALALSMFSEARVCIMRNVHEMPRNKRNEGLMAEVLANLPDSTRLILTSSETRPPAVLPQAEVDRMKVVQFWRYFDEDIYSYVQAALRQKGVAVKERAVERLLELTGKDIRKIDDAIDMIVASGAQMIDAETVSGLVHDVSSVNMFEFVDALFRKEKKSLKILSKLLEDGTPGLLLLSMVQKQAELIEHYHSLVASGLMPEEAMQKSGVAQRGRDKFWHFVKAFPREKIGRVFPLIALADYRLKSSGRPSSLVADPVFELASSILFEV